MQARPSRLIWYLDATARLAEQVVYGRLVDMLKSLDEAVCGKPITEYGDMIKDRMQGRVAIADDIAGWDTKVSLGMLRLQAELLDGGRGTEDRLFERVLIIGLPKCTDGKERSGWG